MKTNPVSNVHVLAGRLAGGPLRRVQGWGLHPGRYVLLVGGQRLGYYIAFGLYGAFVLRGGDAYRLCYDWGSSTHRLVRTGITDVDQLSRLFARALA